jgi:MoxR-like ATPase
LNFEAQAEGIDTDHVLLEILERLPEKADESVPVAAVVVGR